MNSNKIPKPDGSKRPLGIPTVLDRVIQQAMAQVLSPLFDADFSESSYGFRSGRQAHAAIERISDKRVLRLIGKYFRAGVLLEDGSTEKTLKGVPQGGPLSPLLANIMLDPLDKKIEAMGLPFARYADDCAPRRNERRLTM